MPPDQSGPYIKGRQKLDYLMMSVNASAFPQSLLKSARNNQVTKRKQRNRQIRRSWSRGDRGQEQTFWEKGEKQQPPRSEVERLKMQTSLLSLGAVLGYSQVGWGRGEREKQLRPNSHRVTLEDISGLDIRLKGSWAVQVRGLRGEEERMVLAYKHLYRLLW